MSTVNRRTAEQLLREPIEKMSLEQLQRHKVRLIDAWRESMAEYGFYQAVKDGFYKVATSDSVSGYIPANPWLTHNLDERLNQTIAREAEMLRT